MLIPDIIIVTGISLFLGLIGYSLKNMIKNQDILATKFDGHIKEDQQIPKILILEKLENLCEKQDLYQEVNNKRFDQVDIRLNNIEIKVERKP